MFAKRIRILRKEYNLSHAELAKEVGETEATVMSWELGESKPKYSVLIAITQYFNVSTDYLLGITSEHNSGKEVVLLCDDKPLSKSEHELLTLLRLLPKEGRESISNLMSMLNKKT